MRPLEDAALGSGPEQTYQVVSACGCRALGTVITFQGKASICSVILVSPAPAAWCLCACCLAAGLHV